MHMVVIGRICKCSLSAGHILLVYCATLSRLRVKSGEKSAVLKSIRVVGRHTGDDKSSVLDESFLNIVRSLCFGKAAIILQSYDSSPNMM